MSHDGASASVELDALWQHVLDGWEEDHTHAALLAYALRAQALPAIAARYRAVAAVDPRRGEVAKKKLDAIVFSATEMLLSTKTRAPGKVPLPITLSALGVGALMVAWLALVLWGSR